MINKLKEVLVGKEFKHEDYSEGVNNLVKQFGLEANTWDFEFERLYNSGYEEKDNWDAEYRGNIEIEYFIKGDEEEGTDEEYIRIIDVSLVD